MSPVQELAALWRTTRHPAGWSEIAAARARLYTAATHTITSKAAENIPYDPANDISFQWACQWLQVAEGERRTIDENLTVLLEMRLNVHPTTDRKLLAAGSLD